MMKEVSIQSPLLCNSCFNSNTITFSSRRVAIAFTVTIALTIALSLAVCAGACALSLLA